MFALNLFAAALAALAPATLPVSAGKPKFLFLSDLALIQQFQHRSPLPPLLPRTSLRAKPKQALA